MALKIMECPKCGSNLEDISTEIMFCPHCGVKLKDVPDRKTEHVRKTYIYNEAEIKKVELEKEKRKESGNPVKNKVGVLSIVAAILVGSIGFAVQIKNGLPSEDVAFVYVLCFFLLAFGVSCFEESNKKDQK